MRPGKRVALGDGRLGKGVRRIGNLYARLFARVVAADLDRDVPGECRKLLLDVQEEWPFFGYYFIVSCRTPSVEG